MSGLGDEFRVAREARHLSLSDVSEQIHIRSVYLQSIEHEDWSAVAAPVYVRGFVRTYARFLGLDPEHAVAQFNDSIGSLAARPHEHAVQRSIRTSRRPSPWLIAAGLAALALVAFVGYRYVQFQQEAAMPATVAAASLTPSASAAATSTPIAKLAQPKTIVRTLEIDVTAPSWLLVRMDGAQVLQGILPAGTHKSFHGGSAFVRAGNAGGVQLRVNGKDLGAMGQPGSVIERRIALAVAGK